MPAVRPAHLSQSNLGQPPDSVSEMSGGADRAGSLARRCFVHPARASFRAAAAEQSVTGHDDAPPGERRLALDLDYSGRGHGRRRGGCAARVSGHHQNQQLQHFHPAPELHIYFLWAKSEAKFLKW